MTIYPCENMASWKIVFSNGRWKETIPNNAMNELGFKKNYLDTKNLNLNFEV